MSVRSNRRQFLGFTAAAAAGKAQAQAERPSKRNSGRGKRRLVVIGIGSGRIGVIRELISRGRLPAFARLLSRSATAEDIDNFHVGKTHTGWMNIGTGATGGTHRVFNSSFLKNGVPPQFQSLIANRCKAEFLWEAAEKQGKNVILLAWPDSWPSRLKRGIQVGGACLGPNATFYEGEITPTGGPDHRFAFAADQLFSTEPGEGRSKLVFEKGSRGLAARVELACANSDRPISEKPVLWLEVDKESAGASLYQDSDRSKPLARVRRGAWSPRIDISIRTANGAEPAAFRVKLLTLDPRTGSCDLYVTPICALNDGRFQPLSVGRELASLSNFAVPTPATLGRYTAHGLDLTSQREFLEMANRWHAEAARALLRKDFDLFMTFTNNIDWAEHATHNQFAKGVTRKECTEFREGCYEDLDRLVGEIVAAAPEGSTVCLVSEHGSIEPWSVKQAPGLGRILSDAGLLILDGSGQIDLAHTRAFPAIGFVNVLPWQPKTPAEAGRRDANLKEALRVLSSAVAPETGERLCSVVLPWEQAGPFGFHGEREYDILALSPAQYGGIHGASYPLDAEGNSTLRPMFALAGPGVRAGAREIRPSRLEDIAPTLMTLMGIDPPRHCEGRPLRELLL